MDLEYLNTIWQKDESSNRFSIDAESLHDLVRGRSTRFEKQIRHRDWIELVGGFLLGAFFVFAALIILPHDSGKPWTAHWDWLLLGAGCWAISVTFMRLRRKAAAYAPDAADTIKVTLEKNRESLKHQIGLSKSLWWWYCLPVAIPLAIVVIRSFRPETWRGWYSITCILIFAAIILGHRWYANKRLKPRLDSVKKLIEEVA
jgi:hypothetical protein